MGTLYTTFPLFDKRFYMSIIHNLFVHLKNQFMSKKSASNMHGAGLHGTPVSQKPDIDQSFSNKPEPSPGEVAQINSLLRSDDPWDHNKGISLMRGNGYESSQFEN
jgi:hypothetical protein